MLNLHSKIAEKGIPLPRRQNNHSDHSLSTDGKIRICAWFVLILLGTQTSRYVQQHLYLSYLTSAISNSHLHYSHHWVTVFFFNGDKALLNFSDVRKGSLISTYINNFSLYVCLLITPTVGICIQSWGALESTN